MADERNRVPVQADYANDLGMAAWCFAYCEWTVVWCVDGLEEGYVFTIDRKTAGDIAKDFLDRVKNAPDAELAVELTSLGTRFQSLVKDRNGLFHGKPGTNPNKHPRLFRDGKEWKPQDVRAFADRAAALAIEVNKVFHARLKRAD